MKKIVIYVKNKTKNKILTEIIVHYRHFPKNIDMHTKKKKKKKVL